MVEEFPKALNETGYQPGADFGAGCCAFQRRSAQENGDKV
jgi:hypothetical protein